MKAIKETTLKQWSEMTNNNQHTEVLLDIANYFMVYRNHNSIFSKYYNIFYDIKYICREENGCPVEIFQYRTRKTHEMLDDIKRLDGEEIYNQVNDCL